MEIEVLAIELEQEPIELCKLLKIANLVGGGGEAKMVISEGYVYLNGEVEYQKRKKIYFEDIVQYNGEAVMTIQAEPTFIDDKIKEELESPQIDINQANKEADKPGVHQTKPTSKPKKKVKSKSNKSKTSKSKSNQNNPKTGRKSISF